MIQLHELPWDPMPPAEVAGLFRDWDRFWCIAGGWAIDLIHGGQTREHEDTDVLVLRHDADELHNLLPGWELYAADPPGTLRLWHAGEPLPEHVHDIWCRPAGSERWQLQLMVMDHDDDTWMFRRDPAIGGPLASLRSVVDGIPVIAPEVQLLYKSKGLRPKDVSDFRAILPHLTTEQRQWLRSALTTQAPAHPWLDELGTDAANT